MRSAKLGILVDDEERRPRRRWNGDSCRGLLCLHVGSPLMTTMAFPLPQHFQRHGRYAL